MNRIFLSDLHLDSVQSQAFARFSECLSCEAGWADEIIVLGDLFEAWIGDDDDSDLAEGACSTLREAGRTTRVLLMPGNRDFLWGPGFASRHRRHPDRRSPSHRRRPDTDSRRRPLHGRHRLCRVSPHRPLRGLAKGNARASTRGAAADRHANARGERRGQCKQG